MGEIKVSVLLELISVSESRNGIDSYYRSYMTRYQDHMTQVYCEAPHVVKVSPAGVSYNPRGAGVKGVISVIPSTTDNHRLPRQEGLAVESPLLRQGWDGAGVEGKVIARGEGQAIVKAHLHLP